MPEKQKVIIVSPNEEIFDFFQDTYKEWDFQIPVASLEQLYSGIEHQQIDQDNTKIIIFDDSLVEDEVNELSSAIGFYAPYAIVFLLSYREGLLDLIIDRSQEEMKRHGQYAPFFIARQERALDDIDEVVEYNQDFLDGQVDTPQELPQERLVGNPALIKDDEIQEVIAENKKYKENGPLGYVIVSTSSKGGSGKSTVALTLGTTIAQASRKAYEQNLTEDDPLSVCVVDMDIRDGQIGYYIGQLQPTALNIRVAGEITPEVVSKNLVYDDRMGISALLAPKRSSTASDLSGSFYRQVIETLKTMFDLIILDTSVQYYDTLAKDVCFPLGDAILFISNLSAGSVYGLTRWVQETSAPPSKGGQGLDLRKVGIVFNSVMDDVGMGKDVLSRAAEGVKIISMIPMDSKTVIAASNFNRMNKLPENLKIGPSYFKLAEIIVRGMSERRQKPIPLAPLITDKMRAEAEDRKRATVSVETPQKKRKGFFAKR